MNSNRSNITGSNHCRKLTIATGNARPGLLTGLLFALALAACHPDDDNRLAPGTDPTPVPLCATAALPGAEISGATRAATSRPISFATTPEDVFTLKKYPDGAATADEATAYAYTFAPKSGGTETENAAATLVPYSAGAGDPDPKKLLYVSPGSNVRLAMAESTVPLTMALPTQAAEDAEGSGSNLPSGASATATVPFRACMELKQADYAVGKSGAVGLPLTYTSAALRLRLKLDSPTTDAGGNVTSAPPTVATVICRLPMQAASTGDADAPNDGTRQPTRTDGFGGNAPVTQQTVIFGTLTPGNGTGTGNDALTPGTPVALLQLSDDRLLSVSWPAGIGSVRRPQAGEMMTLTVHVSHTVAYIEAVQISAFTPGNGGGVDVGSKPEVGIMTGDGTKPLDANIFNAQHPYWRITGGGTPEADAQVLENIRKALDKAGNDQGTTARIYLELPEVTTLPIYSSMTGAFKDYKNLAGISAPKATAIGQLAFDNCSSLTNISLPEATTIEISAFYNCTSLATLSLPKATKIGSYAFNYCTSLTTASLPKATTIGERAFDGCTSLASISLPEATAIRSSAFYKCSNLTTISLPEATAIGSSAFNKCSNLTTANLPKATTIGSYAFSNCNRLVSLDLSGVTDIANIDAEAFSYFDNYANCALVLSQAIYNGSDATTGNAYVTASTPGGPKDTFLGLTWKSITPKQP